MTEHDTGAIWKAVVCEFIGHGTLLRSSEMMIATRQQGFAYLARSLAELQIKPAPVDVSRNVRRNARRKGYRVYRDPGSDTWSVFQDDKVLVAGLSFDEVDRYVRKLRGLKL